MPYLIIPSDVADFEIDPAYLSFKLHEYWPMTEIRQGVPDTAILLEWEITARRVNHVGMLHSDKRTLTVDDYPAGVAEFAVWYKKVIAEKNDIFICHDSDASLMIRITSETTMTEIKDRLEDKD